MVMMITGWERKLMVDANQKWGRAQAIQWMKQVDDKSCDGYEFDDNRDHEDLYILLWPRLRLSESLI